MEDRFLEYLTSLKTDVVAQLQHEANNLYAYAKDILIQGKVNDVDIEQSASNIRALMIYETYLKGITRRYMEIKEAGK